MLKGKVRRKTHRFLYTCKRQTSNPKPNSSIKPIKWKNLSQHEITSCCSPKKCPSPTPKLGHKAVVSHTKWNGNGIKWEKNVLDSGYYLCQRFSGQTSNFFFKFLTQFVQIMQIYKNFFSEFLTQSEQFVQYNTHLITNTSCGFYIFIKTNI